MKFTLEIRVFYKKTLALMGHHGPATLLKKKLLHNCFPMNVAKFLRTPLVIEHLRATTSAESKMKYTLFYKQSFFSA